MEDGVGEIRQNTADCLQVGTLVAMAFALYGSLLGRHADQLAELSELGIAVLGYRAGDAIEWAVPGRTRRVRIESVLYQPEAADSASGRGDERG